jgi:sugar fermentation stimulation protein A
MHVDKLVQAVFLKRVTRFSAYVNINGRKTYVFVPNPSNLKDLLKPNARVILRNAERRGSKTVHDLTFVYDGKTLVSIDSRFPSKIFNEAILNKQLHEFSHYHEIVPEHRFGNSRFDLLLVSDKKCLVETKSCSWVVGSKAMFPDVPTKRGVRHLKDLIRAKNEGYRACLIFIVQRDDAEKLCIRDDIDPKFSQVLNEAIEKGVEIYAYNCSIKKDEIRINRRIKVIT